VRSGDMKSRVFELAPLISGIGRVASRVARWVIGLAIALGGLAAAHPALAQGCPLCYNTAASAGARGIAALRNGILILMIPPVVIFGLVCYFTMRWGNRFNDEVEVEGRGFEGGDLHDVRI